MSLMTHSADENTVKKKMKQTFAYRRSMVLDSQLSSNILSHFPRFKDVTGLIEQDFVLMFGEDVSGKLLENWPTMFKEKIIKQCRKLPSTTNLDDLLLAADPQKDDAGGADFGWDSDISSILLLLHLLPPTAQGKMSASRAENILWSSRRMVFDHPHYQADTTFCLLSLVQGSGSLADYTIEFWTLAAEVDWTDSKLKAIFKKGLSEQLKD
ncbi:uncharacterized protein LOC117370482 [Periophthalmus magnuspinnatus]|uniref:uncharacterized protein LOC117370482 n=1 Tax=Periophthalmus magnuspinnatus TaxID=409849 RepID=UPI00243705A2|nr:uncharacterized protein LOC117370482 [Periophthalmus magnuspinnatus]